MSEVISFRLDPDNPREVSAILVLQTWKDKGFSIRQIMAEALLKLETNNNNESDQSLSDLFRKLEEISVQLEGIIRHSPSIIEAKRESSDEGLSHQFVQSIKFSVLPGLRSTDHTQKSN